MGDLPGERREHRRHHLALEVHVLEHATEGHPGPVFTQLEMTSQNTVRGVLARRHHPGERRGPVPALQALAIPQGSADGWLCALAPARSCCLHGIGE